MQITVTIIVVVIVKIFNKNANLVAVMVLAILNQKMQIKLISKAKLVARIAIRRAIAKKEVKVQLKPDKISGGGNNSWAEGFRSMGNKAKDGAKGSSGSGKGEAPGPIGPNSEMQGLMTLAR